MRHYSRTVVVIIKKVILGKLNQDKAYVPKIYHYLSFIIGLNFHAIGITVRAVCVPFSHFTIPGMFSDFSPFGNVSNFATRENDGWAKDFKQPHIFHQQCWCNISHGRLPKLQKVLFSPRPFQIWTGRGNWSNHILLLLIPTNNSIIEFAVIITAARNLFRSNRSCYWVRWRINENMCWWSGDGCNWWSSFR